MDKFKMVELEEKLESALLSLVFNKAEETWIEPTIAGLENFKKALNDFFDCTYICNSVIFTDNTDNNFFGVHINPDITPSDAMIILASDDNVTIDNYDLELDSRLFDIGLTAGEICSIIIYEISSMFNPGTIYNVKAYIDLKNLKQDDIIYLRDSVNYAQLVIFAIKDTMYKVSSIMFKDDVDDITTNEYIMSSELDDDLIAAIEKINSSVFGTAESTKQGSPSIMNWMLIMYKDMKHNSRIVKDTLKDAKVFTGSRLVKLEIDKTIASVDKIETEIVIEGGNITKVLEAKNLHSLMELSMFQSLKRSGLKSLEDSYYEFQIRVKTCNDQDDALFILRGINSRLNILEDYLYSNPDLSEFERKRWEELAMKYRALRAELGSKKIVNKIKTYGLFTDYDDSAYYGYREQAGDDNSNVDLSDPQVQEKVKQNDTNDEGCC
jgi:hypothetical protein